MVKQTFSGAFSIRKSDIASRALNISSVVLIASLCELLPEFEQYFLIQSIVSDMTCLGFGKLVAALSRYIMFIVLFNNRVGNVRIS